MYDETLTGPRELPAYPPSSQGVLKQRGFDSLAETIEAFYKREAGDTKPCRQRDGAN